MSSQNPVDLSPKELFQLLQKNNSIKPFLIDVREQFELDIAKLPFDFLHLPLSESVDWMQNLKSVLPNNRPVVVICHAGIRSLSFANWLLEQGLDIEVFNLKGGIDAWSVDIDSSISRY